MSATASSPAGKRVRDSEITFARTMSQLDANLVGNVHGGVIMREVDSAGGTAAARHSGVVCVTAAIDELSTTSAYLVLVALGDDGTPVTVPALLIESEEERRRQAQARIRREARQERIRRLGTYGPEPGATE